MLLLPAVRSQQRTDRIPSRNGKGIDMMTIGALVTVAMIVCFGFILTRPEPQPILSADPGDTSPLDQAARILASRYARGAITAEEYERMLVILGR